MAFTTLCTDSFNRANGNLNGSTLDNANGGSESDTWTSNNGSTWGVSSNQAVCTNGAGGSTTTVSSTAATAEQRVSIIELGNGDCGPVARWNTGAGQGGFYLYYAGNATLYRADPTASYTALGSGGGPGPGDTMSVECDATTGISALKNGSLVAGPATDATYATGVPGMYGGGANASTYDDFKYETVVASGIAFDAASNSGYQAAQSTYSWSHTCTGAGRYLSVDIEMLSLAQTVTGITYNNVPMTLIGVKNSVSGAARVECWGLVAPSTGSNTIAVTLSGSIASAGTATSYTVVNQTFPVEAFNSAQATNVGAADATVNITTVTDNCWVHAACATDDASITAGNTSRNNVTGAGGSGANEDNNAAKTPAGSVTMSYTGVGALATWVIAGYALRPQASLGMNSFFTFQ